MQMRRKNKKKNKDQGESTVDVDDLLADHDDYKSIFSASSKSSILPNPRRKRNGNVRLFRELEEKMSN